MLLLLREIRTGTQGIKNSHRLRCACGCYCIEAAWFYDVVKGAHDNKSLKADSVARSIVLTGAPPLFQGYS
jgi:hypothetical protein